MRRKSETEERSEHTTEERLLNRTSFRGTRESKLDGGGNKFKVFSLIMSMKNS